MNYIQKLLGGEKVEWKTLGEVCNFRNGFAFKSNKFKEEGEAILRIGNIQNQNIELSDLKYFDKSEYKENLKPFEIKKGDILVAMSGATTGKVGMLKTEGVFYLNQRVGKFEPIKEALNNNYLYHYLLSQTNQLYILAGGGAQPNLSSTALMEKIKIPIPPLAVQQKIAEILDRFAELEAELEAELHLREKQYNYYRNHLLTPNEEGLLNGKKVEWKSLGEIGDFYGGLSGKNKNDFSNGNAKFISYMNVFSNISTNLEVADFVKISENEKQNSIQYGDVLFTGSSENLEECGMSSVVNQKIEDDIYLNSFCFGYRLNNSNLFLPDFFKFLFRSTEIRRQIVKTANGVTRFNVSKKKMEKIKIPIPPMEEQERIVKILDKFDTLVNSISEGLPKEIALRRKQYEYYREQLLSF